MTIEEYVKEGNLKIAKFMGVEFKSDHTKKNYWHYEKLRLVSDSLSFHENWNWLMPVVEKIEEYSNVVTKCTGSKFQITVYTLPKNGRKIFKCHTISKINSTYRVVLEFIDWFNKQQEQTL